MDTFIYASEHEDVCGEQVWTGPRAGDPCGYRVSTIIAPRAGYMFQVCGYHARSYVACVRYPLWANLERIRAWQMGNLAGIREHVGA